MYVGREIVLYTGGRYVNFIYVDKVLVYMYMLELKREADFSDFGKKSYEMWRTIQ